MSDVRPRNLWEIFHEHDGRVVEPASPRVDFTNVVTLIVSYSFTASPSVSSSC